MNKQLLKKVRDAIADESNPYNQLTYWLGNDKVNLDGWRTLEERTACGTPGCIAGWAVALSDVDRSKFLGEDSVIRRLAQEVLGLSCHEARRMFQSCPSDPNSPIVRHVFGFVPDRYEAVAMLNKFIETGKVEWRCFKGRK